MKTVTFPASNRDMVVAALRQMKQAEAQMKGAEQKVDLIIDATAGALGVPEGWQLDMRGEVWMFVEPAPETEEEVVTNES